MLTSLSDSRDYRAALSHAATADGLKAFKRDPEILRIMEHLPDEMAGPMLARAAAIWPEVLRRLPDAAVNDEIGGARVIDVEGFGRYSASTCRYVKVAAEIKAMYGGDLSQIDIVEIGGGYGGQALVIDRLFSPRSYTIVDLPEALELQHRYLQASDFRSSLRLISNGAIPASWPSSLFISNYALTEVRRPIGIRYLEAFALSASAGYVIGNRLSSKNLTKKDILARLPEARVQPEIPLTFRHNYLLTWGLARTA
ncbi:putative sugar O-methyltransferase [Kribbella sp. NPDC051587]|uniref:putative sugar O-methyltransferase n=1 Tax=Kribbella sp. NPDC051587 TaxID=3364119 RepID=UPI00378EC1B6